MSENCVKRCCVIGCPNNTRKNLYHSFFRFPVLKERCVEWLEAINRQDILTNGFKIASYRICESHFEPSSISKYKAVNRLAKNAIPTLNLTPPDLERSERQIVGVAGPSKVFETKLDRTGNLFTVPSKKVKLVTCETEIVSIPHDPMFKYPSLTMSATKIIDYRQNNLLRTKKQDTIVGNLGDNPIDASNIKTEIPEQKNSPTSSNISNKPLDTVYDPGLKTESEKHTMSFRSSQTYQHSTKKMKFTEDEEPLNSEEMLDEKEFSNSDHSSTEKDKQMVSIRPICNNMLEFEVHPHGFSDIEIPLIKTEKDEESSEILEKHDTVDIKSEDVQDLIDISETEFVQ